MSELTRSLIVEHWTLANARRWDEFADLLDPALRYELPQTREYIESGDGYLQLFRTWPGDWRATIRQLVCEESKAICVIDFDAGDDERMTGISVFAVSDGRIVGVTDYWPAPYEPPARATSHMKRRHGGDTDGS